jgi:hypothetical protein
LGLPVQLLPVRLVFSTLLCPWPWLWPSLLLLVELVALPALGALLPVFGFL